MASLLMCTDYAFSQLSEDKKSYTVKEGDTIKKVATKLGDANYWKSIYVANIDILLADSTLSEGQVLTLPPFVTESLQESEDLSATASDEGKLLQEFRDAFNKATAQDSTKKNQKNEDPILEFEGMVLDETRSKMGRDFYDLFYQNWEAPSNSTDFTISITEQPSLGIGTVITVMVDYKHVYSARLQPRYEYIEVVSQQAIAQCQYFIQQQAEVQKQLTGY